jgi:hypothetical protein
VSVRGTPEGIEVLCDCATITVLAFEIDPGVSGTKELAFTCDGCLTPYWYTLTIPEPTPGGDPS